MQITPISAEKAKKLVDEGAVVVDIRGRKEHEDFHIEGCVFDSVDEGKDPLADCEGKVVIFSCLSGKRTSMRAKTLEKRAEDAKCADCHILEGGYNAWKDAGYPVYVAPANDARVDACARYGSRVLSQTQFLYGLVIAVASLLAAFAHVGFVVVPIVMGCAMMLVAMTGRCPLAWLLTRMPCNASAPSADNAPGQGKS